MKNLVILAVLACISGPVLAYDNGVESQYQSENRYQEQVDREQQRQADEIRQNEIQHQMDRQQQESQNNQHFGNPACCW